MVTTEEKTEDRHVPDPVNGEATAENGAVETDKEATAENGAVETDKEVTAENGTVAADREATAENGAVEIDKEKTDRAEAHAAGKDVCKNDGQETAAAIGTKAHGARLMWQLYWAWFRMGLFTFGGGYAMLPMIQKEVIDRYHWATEEEILDYYAIGQCTPGVIAVNTATFVGYKVGGVMGGIISTLGVITPSLLIISAIAALLENFADLAVVQHALAGIRVAVCVLMFVSIEKLMKNGVRGLPAWIIFGAAFVLSYFTKISTVILVIMAGAAGYAISEIRRRRHPADGADTSVEGKEEHR